MSKFSKFRRAISLNSITGGYGSSRDPQEHLRMFRTGAIAVAVLAAMDFLKFDGLYLHTVERMIAALANSF